MLHISFLIFRFPAWCYIRHTVRNVANVALEGIAYLDEYRTVHVLALGELCR